MSVGWRAIIIAETLEKEESRPRCVGDLMLDPEEFATVPSDATIEEALKMLTKHQFGVCKEHRKTQAVLVVSPDCQIIGELSHWSILKSLEPHFPEKHLGPLERAGLSLQAMRTVLAGSYDPCLGDLETLSKVAKVTKVVDAMVPQDERIDANASLTVAIKRMVTQRIDSMLVRQDNEIVGVVRLVDLFEVVSDHIRETN